MERGGEPLAPRPMTFERPVSPMPTEFDRNTIILLNALQTSNRTAMRGPEVFSKASVAGHREWRRARRDAGPRERRIGPQSPGIGEVPATGQQTTAACCLTRDNSPDPALELLKCIQEILSTTYRPINPFFTRIQFIQALLVRPFVASSHPAPRVNARPNPLRPLPHHFRPRGRPSQTA